jgi:RNA polymerase sigma factor for flagellar operon FliA
LARVDASERARLVERHLELVQRAAQLVYRRVRDHVELEELVALGNAGLAEAAQRYQPDSGVAFTTFAWYRVQGAIVDGLRRASPLPRRVWARLVALRGAGEYLEHAAARDVGANQRGAAPASGPDAAATLRSAMSAIRTMYLTSLEAVAEDDLPAELPEHGDRIDTRRLAAKLRAAIDQLPERERALVTKHYWEGKNLLEAGAELGISKSWASRLHAQAVDRLRAIVDDDG